MKRKWLVIILGLLIFFTVFLVGCDSINLEFEDEIPTQESQSDSNSNSGDINKIIFNSEFPKPYDEIEILEEIDENNFLIRTRQETFSDGYFIYTLSTDSWFVLPTGVDYVETYEIMDKNNIRFFMEGTNSESNYHDVPFIIDCKKAINSEDEIYYMGLEKNEFFSLQKNIDFGGKSGHQLNDIVITLGGIQFSFGPQDENDPGYFAAYTIVPYTDISYNEASNEFIITFSDTILDKSINKSVLNTVDNNAYIKLIEVNEYEGDVKVIINFEQFSEEYKNVKFYNAEMGSNFKLPSYLEINFSNEKPFNY